MGEQLLLAFFSRLSFLLDPKIRRVDVVRFVCYVGNTIMSRLLREQFVKQRGGRLWETGCNITASDKAPANQKMVNVNRENNPPILLAVLLATDGRYPPTRTGSVAIEATYPMGFFLCVCVCLFCFVCLFVCFSST